MTRIWLQKRNMELPRSKTRKMVRGTVDIFVVKFSFECVGSEMPTRYPKGDVR
jgi:hypothetical protein